MNKDYIDGFMDGHSEGMAAGFNLMERTDSRTKPSNPEPREFFIFVPSMEAFLEKDIGPNPEDDDLFIKVREVIDE